MKNISYHIKWILVYMLNLKIFSCDSYFSYGIRMSVCASPIKVNKLEVIILDERPDIHFLAYSKVEKKNKFCLHVNIKIEKGYQIRYNNTILARTKSFEKSIDFILKLIDFDFFSDFGFYLEGSGLPNFSIVSKVEKEIVSLYLHGVRTSEISKIFFISKKTIYSHRHNCVKKLGFNNFTSFCIFAFRLDLGSEILTPYFMRFMQEMNITHEFF